MSKKEKSPKGEIITDKIDNDVSLLSSLLDEDNTENIFLVDENGTSVELEQIAVVPVDNVIYAILRPIDADEDSAAVFKIDVEDEDSLIQVEDEKLASKVLDIYNDMIDAE